MRPGQDAAGSDGAIGQDAAQANDGRCAPESQDNGAAYACVAGAIIDGDGAPLAGFRVSACTLETCIVGNTDEAGRYNIQRLPVEPHKMEVFGENHGYATMIFYQEVTPRESVLPTRDVVMVPIEETTAPWPPKEGGTVTIADGRLTLTAAPDVLDYPFGADKTVRAAMYPADKLPPYNITPWDGREADTLAFVVNPIGISTTASIDVVVHGVDASPGQLYRVFNADGIHAVLTEVGTASVTSEGDLVLEPGAKVQSLSMIIFVPR